MFLSSTQLTMQWFSRRGLVNLNTLQGIRYMNQTYDLGSAQWTSTSGGVPGSQTDCEKLEDRQTYSSHKNNGGINKNGNRLKDSSETVKEIHIKFPKGSTSHSLHNDILSSSTNRIVSDGSHKTAEQERASSSTVLYKTHIPTNSFQKAILSAGAAVAAILDPRRHDMVAVLGETTGYSALSRIYTEMVQDEEGQQILIEKPRINSSTIDLPYLSKLPEGTLGNYYIKFLNDNNVTPDSRLPVQFVDDPELAYVMQRYREGHDLFHTVLGMPTNMLGEVAVKWVEAIQTGLPMCYGAAVFGPLRFRQKQRQKYLSVYLPWALRVGRSSNFLMNLYFEKRWEQSMVELRNELNIEPIPES
ncbi:ubiquinone biosynthesis protein COQ4 homolog, mitochondrial isoform X2 [Panulirus ornatus]|uniref:ubiquinone biosynthesis protein COQ4 homolog, mitochondrial isoform X2 n=1 Tax=Panulirus ornatus TaxID=150431 RepID=UPI003A8A79F8